MKEYRTLLGNSLFAPYCINYYRPFFAPYTQALIEEVKKFPREDIAAAAQKHLEWCLCEILIYHYKKLNYQKGIARATADDIGFALARLRNLRIWILKDKRNDGRTSKSISLRNLRRVEILENLDSKKIGNLEILASKS